MSVVVKIRCTQNALNFIRKPPLAAGDINAVRIQWVFCDAWKGFMKTALFARKNEKPYPIILKNDECKIPKEMLMSQGKFYISVIGDRDGVRLTSNTLEYEVNPSLAVEPALPLEPTPDVYAQIMDMLNTKADNFVYNSQDNMLQLMANGMPIGDQIQINMADNTNNSIDKVEIDANGDLVLTFSDGTQQNVGHVTGTNGAVYVPHIDDHKVLTFTLEESPEKIPDPVDLNPFDEWSTTGNEVETQYLWEPMQ